MSFLTLCLALATTTPQLTAPDTWQWYGWQTLAVDAGAFAVQDAVPPGAAIVALVGPQVVHLVHERPGAVIASVMMRLGIVLVIGERASKCPMYAAGAGSPTLGLGDWACADDVRSVVWRGWGAVALFDALVLGWE